MKKLIGDMDIDGMKSSRYITIVSGLPRSGTSMMMRMLEAGGMDILTDHFRVANDDNPLGYYEFEKVRKLKNGETEWLQDANGKAVKVISALLEYLPEIFDYRIIFMRRNINEILASQKKMLINRGEPVNSIDDVEMAQIFQKHLHQVNNWFAQHTNIKVENINYNELLQNPSTNLIKVNKFLDKHLDIESMLAIPDQNLYRQRENRSDTTWS